MTTLSLDELSKKFWKCHVDKNLSTMRELMHIDFRIVYDDGIYNKQEIIDQINSGEAVYQNIDLANSNIRDFDKMQILIGDINIRGLCHSTQFQINGICTEVWIKEYPDYWKVASVQITNKV